MLVGAALIILGFVVFFRPAESYYVLAVLFGVVMLGAGIVQLALAFMDKNYFTGRGWMIVSGIIDILLGILLTINIGISAVTLPFILGFWLMYRGFTAIGFGSDLAVFNVKGSTFTIIAGILLVILAFLVLLQPLLGAGMIVAFLGLAFIMAGIASCLMSWQLRNLHKNINY